MKRLPLLALLAVCSAGAALAQVAPQPAPYRPGYDRRPNGQDFADNYPEHAIQSGMPGIVVLCCSPKEDRTLACDVGIEWPRDQGFGAASLKISEEFRLNEAAAAHYRALPPERIRVPIRWVIEPTPKAYEDAMKVADERIARDGANICKTTAPTS